MDTKNVLNENTRLGAHGDEERMADGRDDLTREGEPELGVGLQLLLVRGEGGETAHQSSQSQETRAKSHSYLLSWTRHFVMGFLW